MILESSRNLLIFNSVKRAVEVYNILEDGKFSEKFLLHGKMKPSHRKKVLEDLSSLKDKPFTLISTQVVEAGVDISSDNLVTEVAPPNQLIQRIGRVARRNEEKANITVINMGEVKPYDEEVLKRSWKWLEDHKVFHPRLPESYQSLLDIVYKGSAEIKGSLSEHQRVINLISDLRIRSKRILEEIECIMREEEFLREFTLPVLVHGEIIQFSPKEVERLYNEGKIEVEDYNKQKNQTSID